MNSLFSFLIKLVRTIGKYFRIKCEWKKSPRSMIPATQSHGNRQETAFFPTYSRRLRAGTHQNRPERYSDYGSCIPAGKSSYRDPSTSQDFPPPEERRKTAVSFQKNIGKAPYPTGNPRKIKISASPLPRYTTGFFSLPYGFEIHTKGSC